MDSSESSYEGALLRLRKLGHDVPPMDPVPAETGRHVRMRELEELASMSCEENERLENELAALREENAQLVRRLAALSDLEREDGPEVVVPRRRGGLLVIGAVVLVAIGALAFALVPRPSAPVAVQVTPAPVVAPPAPVVAPPAPVVAPPVVPVAAPAPVVAVAPTITIPPVAPTKTASKHHASKHAAHAKKKTRLHASRKSIGTGNDPLGGLSL